MSAWLSLHGGYLSLIKDKLTKVFHFDIVTGPIKFMMKVIDELKHLNGGQISISAKVVLHVSSSYVNVFFS